MQQPEKQNMSFLDDIIIYTVTIQTDIEEGDNTFDGENGDLGENVDGDKKSDDKELMERKVMKKIIEKD